MKKGMRMGMGQGMGKGAAATRRSFLRGAASALALPAIIPAGALGRDGLVPPSEKIVLGAIGVGNRGIYDLGFMLRQKDVRFVAVCDVRQSRRKAVKELADRQYGDRGCAAYRDMFELLARRDIDAVLVATGDRWHSLASILAAKAGKDVYSEKPCGITMQECDDLADAMNRYGRIFQAGTQRRSISNFQFACHLARSGRLGRIHTVHASIYRLRDSYDWLPAEPEPPAEVCDWDRWLGPCPWRPYNHRYVQGQWRGYHDFDSGATLLDWGAHTVDLCQMALGADGTTPLTYEPMPDGNTIVAEYADKTRLVMRVMNRRLGTCPVRFEGDEGWVETGDSGRVETHPLSLQKERARFARSIAGTDPSGHIRNFFDCVKSRADPACGPEEMRYTHLACHAAATAWMLKRKVAFDPVKRMFLNDDEANAMRSRAKRAPWHV